MVNAKDKRRMVEYLEDKLQQGGHIVDPKKRKIIGNINSSYLLIDDTGVVLLIDQPYANKALGTLVNVAKQSRNNIGVVLYKDGKTFFRAAAPDNNYKSTHNLSLKHYSTKETRRMINLRPEEKHLKANRKVIQYYQPDSANLDEMLVSFNFKPVRYDYSHQLKGQFQPTNKDSDKVFMWHEKIERDSPLILHQNYLKQKP